jgi:hypothetical protein
VLNNHSGTIAEIRNFTVTFVKGGDQLGSAVVPFDMGVTAHGCQILVDYPLHGSLADKLAGLPATSANADFHLSESAPVWGQMYW